MSTPLIVTLTIDRAEMAERGRLGGIATRERHDPRETTKAGRAAFLSRFASDEERRAYFATLGRKSAEARLARAGLAGVGTNGGA
jgi:hypothetical protein